LNEVDGGNGDDGDGDDHHDDDDGNKTLEAKVFGDHQEQCNMIKET